jgi:hypothetical protein
VKRGEVRKKERRKKGKEGWGTLGASVMSKELA